MPPIELPMEEPGVELAGGSDDCGCARELTSCLLAATWALNQCLSTARGTVGEAICLGIYEVRVGLCYQEVARCIARCVV